MANEILTGEAVLNGIQNDGSAITISGFATFILGSLSPSHMFDIEDVKDELGFDTATIARNQYMEATLDLTPSGATRAAAAAVASYTGTLVPLYKVTIANCKVTDCNGDWQYRGGGRVEQSAGQVVRITGITIRKYANSEQNASLTTTVTG